MSCTSAFRPPTSPLSYVHLSATQSALLTYSVQNGTADTSNFDEEFTREQPTLTPVHTQLSSRDQAEFNGFSWVASWADI